MPIFMVAGGWVAELLSCWVAGWARETAQQPSNSATEQPTSRLPPAIRRDHVVDFRRLLGHERFAVFDADQGAEVAAAGFDHLQKLFVGDEGRRLFRFRIVEL